MREIFPPDNVVVVDDDDLDADSSVTEGIVKKKDYNLAKEMQINSLHL